MTAVVKQSFGELSNGRAVHSFTLSCGTLQATIVEYGATLISFLSPDKNGTVEECTLSHRTLTDLQTGTPQCFYGATIGRVGNRIAGGTFTIGNDSYQLATNNGPNCLHGGSHGWDKKLWNGKEVEGKAAVTMTLESPDGDEGFPGAVSAQITYTLTTENELRLDYSATTTKPTPISLTNHTYWNLSGNCKENILKHRLKMSCNEYLPVNETSIPSGGPAKVDGTPFDFRQEHGIGDRIHDIGGDPGGYDHCYVIDKGSSSGSNELRNVAGLECPTSGRTMSVSTDQPGVQLYTGNYLDGDGLHKKHGAMCLETQAYPDAINQWPTQVILKPGTVWSSTTVHKFGVK
jgi:aldose 1-epimerase